MTVLRFPLLCALLLHASEGAHLPEKSRHHDSLKHQVVTQSIENAGKVDTLADHQIQLNASPPVTQKAYDEYKRGVEALNKILKPENLKTIRKLTDYLSRKQKVKDNRDTEEQALTAFQGKLAVKKRAPANA